MSPIHGFPVEAYIQGATEARGANEAGNSAGVDASAASAFTEALEGAVASANAQAQTAHAAAEAFAVGAKDDIHGTMLALSKADIELRLVGNIRNKVLDAFHEIWKMQL